MSSSDTRISTGWRTHFKQEEEATEAGEPGLGGRLLGREDIA